MGLPFYLNKEKTMNDDPVKRGLEDIKNNPEKYPAHLKTATRAEFVTMIRKNQEKPGCRLFMLLAIFSIPAICGAIMQLVTMLPK